MGVLAPEIEATYEVLSKMGEGGMGAVYKVRHRFFDEIRVVKVMQGDLEPLPELKERFLGEAKRGKQLRHPNLAEVIDFSIAADGTAYMVMEFVDGTNLRDVLARNGGPLDYREVVPIAEQALAALGFLHGRKFVHRDISPDNLMLTNDGDGEPRVKLIDLGIAKSLESTRQLTMAGKFIGKVSYASPEQFGGEVDGRSDIYSLAIVLYELLTNVKPVTGDNPMSIIGGHLSRPPRAFEETDRGNRVPPALRNVILKALAKRPEDRYPTAEAFAEALRETIPPAQRRTESMPIVTRPAESLPVVAPVTPAPPAPPPREQGVRTNGILIAAIAATALLAVIVVLWTIRTRNASDAPPVATTATTAAPETAGTTMSVAAAAADPGQLLINALPWGNVTSVRDAEGVERLTGGPADTPLVLSLPAGQYKVRLTNPNSNTSVELDATVKAGATSRYEAELDRVDAEKYVDGIGLGRQ